MRLIALLLVALLPHAAAFMAPMSANPCPRLSRSATAAMMADVTVKFPGGKSATVPDGSPLSLAAYQVCIARGPLARTPWRESASVCLTVYHGRVVARAGRRPGDVSVQGRDLRIM